MSYIKFNNHPKGLNTSDCVVRAISKAFDNDYLETRRELNRLKRELGFQSYKDTKFLYKHLEDYERIILKAVRGEPRIKGYDFTEMYPKGTYILKMAGHISVMIDGVIYDTWDCRYRTVYTAWKVN
ncbi:MAG: hypothetical protein ACOX5Y_04655 [Acholeplasmataceae bacterium]|jgi:hypothetical protein